MQLIIFKPIKSNASQYSTEGLYMQLIIFKPIKSNASQYSTVVLTVVRVMIAKYRKSGIWGYRSSLTPEPIELKLCTSDYVAHRTQHAPRGN